jgi:hypothetical protein
LRGAAKPVPACAADASLGIEFARVYRPEVILMDINLSSA